MVLGCSCWLLAINLVSWFVFWFFFCNFGWIYIFFFLDFLVIIGSSFWLICVFSCSWWTFGNVCWFLVMVDGSWRFLIILGGFWWFLEAFVAPLFLFCGSSLFLVALGCYRCFLVFLAARSSSRTTVVGLLVRRSVRPSVRNVCEKSDL